MKPALSLICLLVVLGGCATRPGGAAQEEPVPVQWEPAPDALVRAIEACVRDETRERLSGMGVEIGMRDAVTDGERFAFTLTLHAPQGGYEQELSGRLPFQPWGVISAVDPETVAVSTPGSLTLYRAGDLSPVDWEADLSSFAGKEYTLLGAGRTPDGGLAVPMRLEDGNAMAFFSSNGALAETRPVLTDMWPGAFGLVECFSEDAIVLDRGQFYCPDTGRLYGASYSAISYSQGEREFELLQVTPYETDPPPPERSMAALYRENGFPAGCFPMDGTELTPSWGMEREGPIVYEADPERPVLRATDPFCRLTITLDFEAGTGALDYAFTWEDLEGATPLAFSENGRYGVYATYGDGAGDAGWSSVVLWDTREMRARFLCVDDAGANVRFGNNGLVFINRISRVELYDPSTGERTSRFDLGGDRFAVGSCYDEARDRYLLALRASSQDGQTEREPLVLRVYGPDGTFRQEIETGLEVQAWYKYYPVRVIMESDEDGTVTMWEDLQHEQIGTVSVPETD